LRTGRSKPRVPGHELRRVLVDAVEELLDRRRLVALGLADGEHLHAFAFAQHAADRDDAVQVRRQEVARALHAALLQRDLRHVVVREIRGQVVQAADARGVRDGLDVERGSSR
jgi:hypothetical protein